MRTVYSVLGTLVACSSASLAFVPSGPSVSSFRPRVVVVSTVGKDEDGASSDGDGKRKKKSKGGNDADDDDLRRRAKTDELRASLVPARRFARDGAGNTTSTPLERSLERARARAEIRRLTEGDDAVEFDHVEALRRLAATEHGLPEPLEAATAEAEADARAYAADSLLARAVAAEDFVTAEAAARTSRRTHLDDCGAVLQANARFYRALSERDAESMTRLWLDAGDGTVQCLRPSERPAVGYRAVVDDFVKDFREREQPGVVPVTTRPDNVRLTVKGCAAWIVCDEESTVPHIVRGRGRTKKTVQRTVATNIFRKVDGRWYIVHHHATRKEEFEGDKNNGGKRGNKRGTKASITLGGGLGGLSGPLGLGGAGESTNPDGTVKRVFMGSLSDLLGGGLGEILGDASSSSGSDDNTGNIIRITSADDDNDDDNDDDDIVQEIEALADDDDDDEEEEEDPGAFVSRVLGATVQEVDDSEKTPTTPVPSPAPAPKDALRQNCIGALRKLERRGSISPKQKRILLTDIITCSAKGEFSMVEVAYELLYCGEEEGSLDGDDEGVVEEEFADQCRVFAKAAESKRTNEE